jgi:nucleoside-diphosphate-sugar epimerase
LRAVVTGATGFVGSHLAERLVAGGADVTCLVRPTSALGWLRPLPVRLCQTSLFDPRELREVVAGADVVFHVAGRIRAARAGHFYRDNVDATRALARACADATPGVGRLVVVSSQAAAGPAPLERPAREDDPPRPLSDYGRSKLLAEEAAREAAGPVEVAVVRPPTVYGPRDPALLPLFRLVRWRVAPRLPSNPVVSLVHVYDLVELLWLAGVAPAAAGRTYFGAQEPPTPFDELVRLVGDAQRGRPLQVPVPGPLLLAAGALSGALNRLRRDPRPFDLAKAREMLRSGWVCSSERARHELDWHPRIAHADGLADTAAWYRRHGWL